MAGNSRTPRRSVISKASAIMLTLTEVAGRLGVPLSTVHRLATELAAWRVLERTEDGRYRAGRPVLRAMSGACPCTCDATSLRERAAPIVEDLFRATGRHVPVTALSPAARLPAYATALGKALLAFSSSQSTRARARSPCPSSACGARSPRPSR